MHWGQNKHAHCLAAIIFKHIFLENCINIWIKLYLIKFQILIILLFIVSLELKNSSPHTCAVTAVLFILILFKTTRPWAFVASSLEALVIILDSTPKLYYLFQFFFLMMIHTWFLSKWYLHLPIGALFWKYFIFCIKYLLVFSFSL